MSNMNIATYLQSQEPNYNADLHMLGQTWNGPGYHTRIPNGTWVHPTRTALDYALALLFSGEITHHARAADVIAKTLTLQDVDPTNATYGIWPWLLEESLDEMAPPDWNWADFCGMRLALILADHADRLPTTLVQSIRTSLGHAGWSIFRRNVRPNYTNIAIMGAGVTLAVGELLDEPRLADYGRRRLRRVVEHTEHHGGFNEYNSPTYTVVVLHECENILHLVKDTQARADAETLRVFAWETIAEHFHPTTQQWSGPNSRAYTDRVPASLCSYLSAQTGVEIHPHPDAPERGSEVALPYHLPCPPHLTERFRTLPQPEMILERRFIAGADEDSTVRGVTWLGVDACLGSVNHDCFWTQRRPLLGYWRTDEDPAVVFRLRFLKDGQDFSSVYVRNVQHGRRILSAVNLLTDRGDFHISLDRPADGRFSGSDLRLRYELTGRGVSARQISDGVYELAAGNHHAVIHTAPGQFGERAVTWQLGEDEGRVFLDAVCYTGPAMTFDPAQIGPVLLAAGTELLPHNAPITVYPVNVVLSTEEKAVARWGEDAIEVPLRAHKYQM
jgi:hypothetical protein